MSNLDLARPERPRAGSAGPERPGAGSAGEAPSGVAAADGSAAPPAPGAPEVSGGVAVWQQMSSSRLAVFERCQRQYFYRYRRWFPEEARPILFFGRAVEEAVLAAFAASPPVSASGSLASLLAWAAETAAAALPPILAAARERWEADPNRRGSWTRAIDPARAERMARRPFTDAFHGRMVEQCLAAAEGNLLGAWALARPRHSPAGGDGFGAHMRVPVGPDAWFSGAFDLWYAHAGRSVVVDLKSSERGGMFSSQYREQLCAYSWIHREVTGRLPDAIELWYLGEAAPWPVALPSAAEIDAYVVRARTLFEKDDDIEEHYPAEPAVVPGEARGWCSFCSFRPLCPRTRAAAAPTPPATLLVPAPAALAEAVRADQRVDLRVRVAAIRRAKQSDSGVRYQKVVLADASAYRELTLFGDAIDRHLPVLRRGEIVRLRAARVDVFRDVPGLVLDWSSSVEPEPREVPALPPAATPPLRPPAF